MGEPDGDCPEHGCGAVDDGEFVVAGGQSAPLLDDVEVSLNDVAALVVLGIKGRRSSTAGAASFAVSDLI
jgi:hypothetical protein